MGCSIRKMMVLAGMGALLMVSTRVTAQDKSPAGAGTGTVTYAVMVSKASNAVQAFGLDLLYSTKSLKYQSVERGDLLAGGFSYFGANEVTPGRIRIGGMETGDKLIPKEASGVLVLLTFQVTSEADPGLSLTDLKDDMKGWTDNGRGGGAANTADILRIVKQKKQ